MASKSTLRPDVERLRRSHNALVVIAVGVDEVAFSIDAKLPTLDAEEIILVEASRVIHALAEQRKKGEIR